MSLFGSAGPCVKVCCGPRCGVDPNHRAVYRAVEAECSRVAAGPSVIPTLCRGLCGEGVTVVRADGAAVKVRDARDARTQLSGG